MSNEPPYSILLEQTLEELEDDGEPFNPDEIVQKAREVLGLD